MQGRVHQHMVGRRDRHICSGQDDTQQAGEVGRAGRVDCLTTNKQPNQVQNWLCSQLPQERCAALKPPGPRGLTRAGADCDAQIGLGQCGRVVDAVAHHCHCVPAGGLELLCRRSRRARCREE